MSTVFLSTMALKQLSQVNPGEEVTGKLVFQKEEIGLLEKEREHSHSETNSSDEQKHGGVKNSGKCRELNSVVCLE